jgi:hypothetical protein
MNESTLDERFSGVLAPDAILPAQYFAGLRGRTEMSGERRLVSAILEDALRCFQKHVNASDPKSRQLFVDAEDWIMADDPTWFFSFANVCTTLDLDPDYVREGLLKWRDAQRNGAPVRVADDRAAGDEQSDEEPLHRASA